jgi:hypothetical protein
VSDVIGVLLPGGLAIGLVTLFQAVKSWREGKTSREETAIKQWQRLARAANERSKLAEQDEAFAIILAEYWRTSYAELEFEVRRNTDMEIPERAPIPVKKVRGTSDVSMRRRRSSPQAPEDFDQLE